MDREGKLGNRGRAGCAALRVKILEATQAREENGSRRASGTAVARSDRPLFVLKAWPTGFGYKGPGSSLFHRNGCRSSSQFKNSIEEGVVK
ncbi:hypothetical protein SBBP1_20047 [Burkholderiales bacterium]|nr:hypothetical protein SBBP1_20047 [Burkholderiales bacterium]